MNSLNANGIHFNISDFMSFVFVQFAKFGGCMFSCHFVEKQGAADTRRQASFEGADDVGHDDFYSELCVMNEWLRAKGGFHKLTFCWEANATAPTCWPRILTYLIVRF
jgi:hypothetical protein